MRAGAWMGTVALVLALAGCTAGPLAIPEPGPTSPVVTTPTSADIQPGTVVATGFIESGTGQTSGRVTIRYEENAWFTLELENYSGPEGIVEAQLVPPHMTRDITCYDTGLRTGSVPIESPNQILDLGPIAELGQGDPSFFDAVTFVRHVVPGDLETTDGCVLVVVGFANLAWDYPDQRPDLTVRDSGPTSGALGDVVRAGGKPVSYTVATGDVLSAIADRFGVTVDDLNYLTPERAAGRDATIAYAGEVLNLDRSAR